MSDEELQCVSSTTASVGLKKDKENDERRSSRSSAGSDSSDNLRSFFSEREGSSSSSSCEQETKTSSILVEGDSSSNSPLRSQLDIPTRTSAWTYDHLNSLRIRVQLGEILTPEKIIKTVFKEVDLEPHKARRFKEYILNHAPKGWNNLKKYGCIDDVFQSNLDSLRSDIASVDGRMWAIQPMELSDRFFSQRFHVMGEMFGRYLVYMAELHQNKESITEVMYQTLFYYFLQMLGLLCNADPAIPAKNMKIKSVNVRSIPDMLLLNSQRIIAVFEMKRHFNAGDKEEEPPRKVRKRTDEPATMDELETEKRKIYHLDDKLIGQTGGELLIHLKSSMGQKNRILGIMVQETYVTFTHLEVQEDVEIENNEIKDGDIFLRKNHKMEFSQPYNYLNPEMCEKLMEPLILLGLMQNH